MVLIMTKDLLSVHTNGNEISMTGPLVLGGLGGSGNNLNQLSIHLCSLHSTYATSQVHPKPYLSTRGFMAQMSQ